MADTMCLWHKTHTISICIVIKRIVSVKLFYFSEGVDGRNVRQSALVWAWTFGENSLSSGINKEFREWKVLLISFETLIAKHHAGTLCSLPLIQRRHNESKADISLPPETQIVSFDLYFGILLLLRNGKLETRQKAAEKSYDQLLVQAAH